MPQHSSPVTQDRPDKGTATKPSCYVVSDDPAVIAPFEGVPQELRIGCEFSAGVASAREVLSRRRYDAVVIDCDMQEAFDLLTALRGSNPNRGSVLIAVVRGAEAGLQAFKDGANFILEKPLSAEWTARTLKAANATMWAQYRRHFRFRTNLPVGLTLPNQQEIRGRIKNISRAGLLLSTEEPIKTLKPVPLKIELPGTDRTIEVRAAGVWSDGKGQTGMRFVQLSAEDWLVIQKWLGVDTSESGH